MARSSAGDVNSVPAAVGVDLVAAARPGRWHKHNATHSHAVPCALTGIGVIERKNGMMAVMLCVGFEDLLRAGEECWRHRHFENDGSNLALKRP